MTDPDNVDINAFLTLDLEMHAIWFCSMNKWYIWQNLTKPQPDYSRFTRLDVVRANNVPDVLSEHREILRVIREKDLDAIEPLIRRHLYGGLRRMGTSCTQKSTDLILPASEPMKNRRIRQPFGLWMRLFCFLYNLLLVVLAVLFLVNRGKESPFPSGLGCWRVHTRKQHGGVHIAALEVGQLMHGRCSLLVGSSRAGKRDQDLVGVQAGILAAQIVGLEGSGWAQWKPHSQGRSPAGYRPAP